jgi:very-short-patch-repair endonuclease
LRKKKRNNFGAIEILRMKIVNCRNCAKETIKSTGRYNESIKNGWNFFCSIQCRYSFQEKGREFLCAWCSKSINKTPAQIRKTKNNVFCSKSCGARFNNRNKQTGTRRSKLECYLEHELRLNFPFLNFSCNTNEPIGSELDFYFPELKLAIELNGILHYQPIYGSVKLNRIQSIDKIKSNKCAKAEIKLCIIDVSKETHLTQKIKEKNWKIVKELVTSHLKRADYTIEQVSLL